MVYVPQTWENLPTKTTALSAARLAHIEDGISAAALGPADSVDGKVSLWNKVTRTFDDATTYLKALFIQVAYGAINVKQYGATGDGSTDDYAALAAAHTAGIGKLIYYPDGTYMTSQGLFLDATSSLKMSGGATVKASASMTNILTIGTLVTWWRNRSLTGGVWDCNTLAGGIDLKAGLASRIDTVVLNSTLHGYSIGDPAASNTTHEMVLAGKIDKTASVACVVGSYGVWLRSVASDNRNINVTSVGCERSFRNDGNANLFGPGCHGYGLGAVQYPVAVFSENGSDNEYVGCEADTPSQYGWEITAAAFRWKIRGGIVTNNATGTDNVVIGIHTLQADPNGPCVIENVMMIGADSSHRILKDYDGTFPSNQIQAIGNLLGNPATGINQTNVTTRVLSVNLLADSMIPRVIGFGAGPSGVAGANNGGSPPAPTVDTSANAATDSRGRVSFGSGTGPSAGAQVVLTFARAYAKRPVITLHPVNSASAAIGQWYPSSIGTGSFTISSTGAPTASQSTGTYVVDWAVAG